jgi:hypothetical protein
MATQIVGVLLSVAGILWVGFTLTVLRIRNEQTEALMLLMGVIGFVGGLLLWGLGRVECAISPSPAQTKRSGVLSVILLFVILLAVASVGLLQFFGSSRPPQNLPPAGLKGGPQP